MGRLKVRLAASRNGLVGSIKARGPHGLVAWYHPSQQGHGPYSSHRDHALFTTNHEEPLCLRGGLRRSPRSCRSVLRVGLVVGSDVGAAVTTGSAVTTLAPVTMAAGEAVELGAGFGLAVVAPLLPASLTRSRLAGLRDLGGGAVGMKDLVSALSMVRYQPHLYFASGHLRRNRTSAPTAGNQ